MSPKLALLILTIIIVGISSSFGDEKYGFDGTVQFVARDQYQLEYLGLLGDKNGENHQGVFQLIWNGQKAIAINGRFIGKPETFVPVTYFSYHFESDWELVSIPLGDGFGMSELTIQPEQRSKLVVDMSWLEADFKKPLPVKKARTAALVIGCREGLLISSDFPLPLVP